MAWITKSSDEQYAPEPAPREYTKQEKAANWWHYHKITVPVVVLAAAMAAWLVHDMFFRVQPDVQIGYVGTTVLPAETVRALEQALTPYASDSNGDGQVIVQLDQYAVDFANENADPAGQLAGTTQLTAALAESSGTYLFLLEDPAGFESQIQALQFTDGTLPGEADTGRWQQMVYRWQDCPVLAGLDLGTVSSGEGSVSGQELLAGVYLGCRGSWAEEVPDAYTRNAALWSALTAGASPVEE